MTVTRRTAILTGVSMLAVAACRPEDPASLTISAQGAAGMNPGPDGQDRPLTLSVVQMSGTSAFDGADFFALQNPQAALGGDFISAQQIVLTPGSNASTTVPIAAGATAVGVVAGFREPAGKVFRLKTAAPAGQAGMIVSVGPSGIQMRAA
ncbi:MAG: type VI secretion system lipoprotein TssJ [Pseudomonadota bacterium]